tara:strand:+ start:129 stop:308 length:180 start_codon:yes stop_codon:yes gene_type:complete
MKKIKKNKRHFLKLSSLFFVSLFSLKNFQYSFVNQLKNNFFKFVKRNKKIWILSKNDFN